MAKKSKTEQKPVQMSIQEFILTAIEKLVDHKHSRGIHTVYSGFNEAFRTYFPGKDPIQETKKLEEKGIIEIRPAKRGVMIYRKGDAPCSTNNAKHTLHKMGL